MAFAQEAGSDSRDPVTVFWKLASVGSELSVVKNWPRRIGHGNVELFLYRTSSVSSFKPIELNAEDPAVFLFRSIKEYPVLILNCVCHHELSGPRCAVMDLKLVIRL